IILYDVETVEFDAFLSLFYPDDLDKGDLTTVRQWTAVLKLATRWSITSARKRAIRELSSTEYTTAAARVALARVYNIEEWTMSALMELCMREATLSPGEISAMKAEDVALVMEVRE
ncbi:hypothetical protein K488DRAFT_37290, partial [Vararia minispora EC-137]